MIVQKIISGGQTGVDRAALDVAIELGIPHGGSCPRGRRAEDGTVPAIYRMTELDSPRYQDRTDRNVLDADGTLILHAGTLDAGTSRTERTARRLGRPVWLARVDTDTDPAPVRDWITRNGIGVLNVAGPRASRSPGIASRAADFLRRLLSV